ncbi:hypothetical protein ACJX0J_013008, partial [Zea mays]
IEVRNHIYQILMRKGKKILKMAMEIALLSVLSGDEYNKDTLHIAHEGGPQEIGLGGQDINDHKVVKIMLERFNMLTPSDVLGRILTFDMQREEALERRKIGELQAKQPIILMRVIVKMSHMKRLYHKGSSEEDEKVATIEIQESSKAL